jgi:HD-GYP domain-containing protein (c-di-GMP phosphodiesterase class II)
MSDNIQKFLHTFSALADLGEEISETHDFNEMATTSLHLMLGSLGIMRGAIGEYRADTGIVRLIASRNIGNNLPTRLRLEFNGNRELCEIGSHVFESQESKVLEFVTNNFEWLERGRIEVILPLVVHNNLVGLVLLGEKASGEPYSEDERSVLSSMARQLGVGFQERRQREELTHRAEEIKELYDGLKLIYRDTVRAFAAAIDCKDKYTQGHSDRVGKYCEIIALEMGWSDEEVEGMSIAGYLHDVGKLVVERNIINAPYRINAKESSELNRHPAAGYEILLPIHHPYADIPQAARYHHERIDGRGYPEGLRGDEIPIGARIVSVADSFDAMTTDRPYRRRRSFEEVIEDFGRNTDKQFDRDVVIALCKAMLKEITGETKEKRFRKLLGRDYIVSDVATPKLETLVNDLESRRALTASA